jgi:sortase A
MKKKLPGILLALIFVAGLSLLLYPTISNAYNSWLQSKAIVEYSQQVDQLEEQTYKQEWAKAQAYNQLLHCRTDPFGLTQELERQYWQTLNLTGQGIMGYVQIPTIDVTLPIAHGTSDSTLRDKIGHLEWSSLPVGGESTHCVISGHRGLPYSELFTNIDHLEIGDKFYLHTLGQTLEYQVCNIAVVEPQDQRLLRIEEGQDLVTLVTCTPYGINSHRLLVRGIRTGTGGSDADHLLIKNEVTGIDTLVLVLVLLAILAVAAFLFLLLSGNKKHKRRKQSAQNNEN